MEYYIELIKDELYQVKDNFNNSYFEGCYGACDMWILRNT